MQPELGAPVPLGNCSDPCFGAWGKPKCEDTGALTRKQMETIEEDLLQVSIDFMDKSVKSGKPFFLWHNTTRMHVWARLSPKWQDKSGYGLFADGMMELDWVVGQLLKKLDDLGIADNTIVVLTSDNGAEKFTWPNGVPNLSAERRARPGMADSVYLVSLAGPMSSSQTPSSMT